jgi:hypothetical protein
VTVGLPVALFYCHIQVWEAVAPRLADKPAVLEWLKKNTAPLREQLRSNSTATAAAVPVPA